METISGSSLFFPLQGLALNVLASMKSYVTTGEAALLPMPDKPIRSGAGNYHTRQVVRQHVAGDLRCLMLTLGLIVWG